MKCLLDKIINFKGVSPMEIRMVLKEFHCMMWALWVVDLLLDLSSESSDAYLLCLLLLLLFLCDSLWVDLCWSLSQE